MLRANTIPYPLQRGPQCLSSGLPVLLGALLLAATAPVLAEPADHGLTVEPGAFALRATPPLPDLETFPVQLVLDDDGAESVFGFDGGTARQFLWFNRFSNPSAFTLREIWVLFPAGMDVPVDGDVQLVVFLDPDGDPTNGAELLAAYDEVIQVADGDTFSVYPLADPLAITGAGDVLIGVINRYFMAGVDPPPTLPAALDTTVSQDRSHFALWPGDPPDPPDLDLATADVVAVLDGATAGNFMIRGFGTRIGALVIPTAGTFGLALLAVIVALAGLARVRRRA